MAIVCAACDRSKDGKSEDGNEAQKPASCQADAGCDDGDSCTEDFCSVDGTCRSIASAKEECTQYQVCAVDEDRDGEMNIFCGGSDCNDDDPLASSKQNELCDGVDNNCDGAIDEGCNYYFANADGISDWCAVDGQFRTIDNPQSGQGLVFTISDLGMMYYLARDGKRYIFPNSATFKTWYGEETACTQVRAVPIEKVAEIPIGGNVCYRPGTRLLKIETDSRIYAVAHHCTLRLISEEIAAEEFGASWQELVDVIPDAFFVNYTVGSPIQGASEYWPASDRSMSWSIDVDLDL
jgi:hypothetical protein